MDWVAIAGGSLTLERSMEVVLQGCAGLDVHKKTVVACAITPTGKETQAFGTMTDDLSQLGSWLQDRGISEVAMESSGVYWQPVFNVLEDMGLVLLVANARHIKAVPAVRRRQGCGVDRRATEAWLAPAQLHPGPRTEGAA